MLKPFALAATLALACSAEAHDYGADIICRVTETDGQRSAWSFAPNTIGAGWLAGVDVRRNVLSRTR